ncbi:MAG: hypothetical protein OEV49_02045 [candidate division Zixibacteria bacterium]|nr:hypothetical protein [candidate division Zixibacteria bacterium]MDH3937646.1 hypothetical protein [candidate division Zixibacteria bacterium]MDH4034170.1 hypothetical protein [candidate division Zixibacteria bacterium]
MRTLLAIFAVFVMMICSIAPAFAGEAERDIVDRYLKRAKEKHTSRLSWFSGHFGMNRINRQNDYNKFATNESGYISNGSLTWLDLASSFGFEAGLIFKEKIGWSIGGEYWLKLGDNQSGSFDYNPPGGLATTIDNLKSEVQVWGITTGVQYFVFNPPTVNEQLTKPAIRIGGSVGYYQASWDLWDNYQNLNLATSSSENTNITYKGTGVGFTANIGGDYPLGWNGLVVGGDIGYLMLNFKNVSWYNSRDEEVVASFDGTSAGRVNLDLSGIKGRFEIKRFFSW